MSWFLLFCFICQVDGELWSISTISHPYLTLLENPGHVIHWNNGFMAQKMATSQAVRLNERGIQFIPFSYTKVSIVNEWIEFDCKLEPNCMCKLSGTKNVTSRFFPENNQEVFSLIGTMIDNEKQNFQDLLHGKCLESNTGRITSDDSRDISLCDVTSGKIDMVYFPWKNKIYISSFEIPLLTVVIVSIVTIYVATMLAKNVDKLVNTQQGNNEGEGAPKNESLLSPFLILIALFFNIFPDQNTPPLHMFVTSTDRFAFVSLIVYYFLFNVIHFSTNVTRRQYSSENPLREYSPIAPMVCVLTLFSMRAFGTLDNPYISVLTAIFIARFITKLYDTCLLFHVVAQHLIDAGILCIFIFIGILPQFDYVFSNVFVYVTQCTVVGMTVANLIKRDTA